MFTVQAMLRTSRSLINEDPVRYNHLFDGYGKSVRFSIYNDEVWGFDEANKTITLRLDPSAGYQAEDEDGLPFCLRLITIDPTTICVVESLNITGRIRWWGQFSNYHGYWYYTVPLR